MSTASHQSDETTSTHAEHAVTVVGHDRPGIIASTSHALAELGMNLLDSSMTRLRGQFAMTLVCSGTASVGEVRAAVVEAIDPSLDVTVRALTADASLPHTTSPTWLVSVHGADRLGIVATVAQQIAAHGGNITDLATKLVGELYVLTAEVDLAAPATGDQLAHALAQTAAELQVHITVSELTDDEL